MTRRAIYRRALATAKRLPDQPNDYGEWHWHFGWDLRESDMADIVGVHWSRSPVLGDSYALEHYPYRLETTDDMLPDIAIHTQGDPSDGLLTHWLADYESQYAD